MLPLPRLPAVAALDSALFIGTNWVDLTDGGATTLHKHDHGGQDGLTDDDHAGYFRNAGRAGGQTGIGGTAVGDGLTLKGTSGNGTLTTQAISILVGNNGNTNAFTALNSGMVGIGWTPNVNVALTIGGTVTSANNAFGLYMAGTTLAPANGSGAFGQYFGGNPISVGGGVTAWAVAGWVEAMTKSGAGAISTAYGMYLIEQTIGADNFNLTCAGGKNLFLTGANAATTPVIIRAHASQSGKLLDVQTSGAATMMYVGFNGVLFPVQKTTAAAPAYVKGGMYFDLTLNKMRIGGATAWETVTSV